MYARKTKFHLHIISERNNQTNNDTQPHAVRPPLRRKSPCPPIVPIRTIPPHHPPPRPPCTIKHPTLPCPAQPSPPDLTDLLLLYAGPVPRPTPINRTLPYHSVRKSVALKSPFKARKIAPVPSLPLPLLKRDHPIATATAWVTDTRVAETALAGGARVRVRLGRLWSFGCGGGREKGEG